MSNFLLLAGETPVVHIHIPKTGGSSIRGGAFKSKAPGVFGYKQYHGPHYGEMPKEWGSYWKFAVVRHPMQRWWSAFKDFKHLRGYSGSADDFAEETMAQKNPAQWNSIAHHTQPMTDPALCLSYADKVFRYTPQDYTDIVAEVCAKAGMKVPASTPRLRETPPTCATELSTAMKKRLDEFYAQDYEELGYESL